jgi:hypothetical protein
VAGPLTKNRIDIDQFVALWEADVNTDRMSEMLGVRRERLMQLARQMRLRKRGPETLRPVDNTQRPDPTISEIEERKNAIRDKWTAGEERARRGALAEYEFPRANCY